WRMRLNNYLQECGERDNVTWEIYMSGPQHRPTWHATVYIRGYRYGMSSARTRGTAKEEAARQALLAL
ncbi:hypothetical protein OBBRIDRAFT_703005, partial [Obba rivulosa]